MQTDDLCIKDIYHLSFIFFLLFGRCACIMFSYNIHSSIHHNTDIKSIFMLQTSWCNNFCISTFKDAKGVVRSLLIVSSLNLFLCRKRKCKRMALDPDAPSTSTPPGPPSTPSTLPMAKPTVAITSTNLSSASSNSRKKKVLRPSVDSENRCVAFAHAVRCT